MPPGFFDDEDRLAKLEKLGDSLPCLDSLVDWQAFRPLLKVIYQKQRKSNAERKLQDVTLMFKLLVLHALYNLFDDQTEYQVRDRLSFQRFDEVLDEESSGRSVWAYRSEAREEQLREHGYRSRIHRKGTSRRKLNQQEQATNHRCSKVRARVEHVFGDQRTHLGSILVRTKGKVGAAVKIALTNLTYNMRRLEFLLRPQSACCLLRGLSGRKTTESNGKCESAEKTGAQHPKMSDQCGEMTLLLLATPMAPSEPIYRGASSINWLDS